MAAPRGAQAGERRGGVGSRLGGKRKGYLMTAHADAPLLIAFCTKGLGEEFIDMLGKTAKIQQFRRSYPCGRHERNTHGLPSARGSKSAPESITN